jgi:SNF2 family DNA or RNA helicase
MSETDAKPSFPYKAEPFGPYQRDWLIKTAKAPFFYIAWEQGTGKSWLICNTIAYLFLREKITGAVIIAPSGVHIQWALEQFPKLMPEVVPWDAYIWHSGDDLQEVRRAKKQKRENEFKAFRTAPGRFPILCINTEAITTPLAKKAITTMLKTHKCLLVADEAGDFTTPSAKRTMALNRWRHLAPFRRVLEGVPVGQSPLELYSPYRFLNPRIIGCENFREMQDTYAEWDEFELQGGNGRTFRKIRVNKKTGEKEWKNLDQLKAKIAPYTSRVTVAEALPHLPPFLFHKRFFEMTEEQWRLTNGLIEDMTVDLADGGRVTATNTLTLYLRWQQIACGYVPPDVVWGEEDDAEPISIIPGPNPRLQLTLEEIDRNKTKPTIIWTRFKFDIDVLSAGLKDAGFKFVTYDGRTSVDERHEARLRFQGGDVDYFVGNSAAGGRGLDLYRAERMFYYANYFGLRRRLQSQARARRIGTRYNVNVIDILGHRSIDMKIVKALRNNQDVADVITGDPRKEWL